MFGSVVNTCDMITWIFFLDKIGVVKSEADFGSDIFSLNIGMFNKVLHWLVEITSMILLF